MTYLSTFYERVLKWLLFGAHSEQNPNAGLLWPQSRLLSAASQRLSWSHPLVLVSAQRYHNKLFPDFGFSCSSEGWFWTSSWSLVEWARTLLGAVFQKSYFLGSPELRVAILFLAHPPDMGRWMPASVKIVAFEEGRGMWLAPSLLFSHSTGRSCSFEHLNQK